MADESMKFLAGDVRTRTLRLLEGLTDEQARFAPRGLNNSILWNAGHAYIVIEHLALAPATGAAPDDPPGWFETFGWKSNPANVTDWPSVGDVAERLTTQFGRLMNVIETLTDEQLDRLQPNNHPLRFLIMHALHDEAQHQGEMYLLKKMLRTAASRGE
jgi:hypothetical protein